MEAFLGSIMTFGFAYAPRQWALCNGQVLSINQNMALYALMGVTYGGNAQTTFQLPNLQGRLPMGQGQGAGLSARPMGQSGGSETVTLIASNLPPHTHTASITNLTAKTTITLAKPAVNNLSAPSDTNAWIGGSGAGAGEGAANIYSTAAGTSPITQKGVNTTMDGNVAIGISGSSQSFSSLNPSLVINFSIAMQGIFPTRN